MMSPQSEPRLVHPALESVAGKALAEARLTDQQRLAIVLQAGAVLSHLEHGGWRLAANWNQARIDGEGLLRGVRVQRGRPREPPQKCLRQLLEDLFQAKEEIPGRGQARRAARRLLAEWSQTLRPIPPDQAVEQVFAAAPFLWQRPFGAARRALLGEHVAEDLRRLWVAGRGGFRRRLLSASRSRSELETILASEEARLFWESAPDGNDPISLVKLGRWHAAVAAWRRRPPEKATERLHQAQALYSLARFEEAKAALHGLRSPTARVLRAWCLNQLGELGAARRTIERLEGEPIRPYLLIVLAEAAVRTYGNLGQPRKAAQWVERVLEIPDEELSHRARVLAAVAAWDQRDPQRMDDYIEASRGATEFPEVAWRWHHARGLRAMLAGDGDGVVAHIGRALAEHRRRLRRFEAGALWNELAVGRAMRGDLAGAERAFLHTHRLLGGSQGSRKTTLALFNLAEIRIRRGRLRGVREILERTTTENLLSRNRRGVVQDAELWVRLELVQGRPAAALQRARRALAELDRRGLDWRREVLHLLSARALGWMGRSVEALETLASTTPEAWAEIEPEEGPAVWALAGDRERALRAASQGPLAPLWRALLSGAEAPPAAWECLAEIEPYRAARFVLDAELTEPGCAPSIWRRRAIAQLRRLGAVQLAELLEVGETGPWEALENYLEESPGSAEGLARLFTNAGYPEVELLWTDASETIQVVSGPGGAEELSAPLEGGHLVLRAPLTDCTLRSFLRLAVRDFRPSRTPGLSEEGPPAGGMLGRSPALKKALERLSRLSRRDVAILISGETGTGKELAARHIHALSPRAAGPFVPVSCAELLDSLLLSDLFGHVRGAFTGAERDRAGIFETARGGTVFLDEVGDLPLPAQGKLLRVLEEGEVRRVGESLPRRVDVRMVTATHRDLEAMVEQGVFRRDLYYRLKVGRVELPPLRERGHDLLLLAEHFLSREVGSRRHRLTPQARSRLLGYDWPGNVRELKNVLEVAVALADGERIRPEDLELPYRSAAPVGGYHQKVEDYRRRLVQEALTACSGNRAEAARRLGLSRQALSYLVRKLRIVWSE
ncbi:MAG: sigma 54-interacting transcriptional regulator [Thermoanaerobaculia bacterium]